jgi:hypothetical protein
MDASDEPAAGRRVCGTLLGEQAREFYLGVPSQATADVRVGSASGTGL